MYIDIFVIDIDISAMEIVKNHRPESEAVKL